MTYFKIVVATVSILLTTLATPTFAQQDFVAPAAKSDQVIVFMRHAEKPAKGLGQLSCQGLNRALALPKVLFAKFGKPTAIYAANPAVLKADKGTPYNYVRPLATIEPTAIQAELPVQIPFAFTETTALNAELVKPALQDGVTFVAWEHHLANAAVKQLITGLQGKASVVPDHWDDEDFDSLYVVRIHWKTGEPATVVFEHAQQNLTELATSCPGQSE
jgi:hypothetical protein